MPTCYTANDTEWGNGRAYDADENTISSRGRRRFGTAGQSDPGPQGRLAAVREQPRPGSRRNH